ncbi:MAG: 2-dehydropantoate 2-reductase [Burkholderiaceae bacterium]
MLKKVAIYGAGSIGGWIGVALARAGCDVSVVARGATLAAIQRDGLRLHRNGKLEAAPVTASDDPAKLGVQDLVVIAVKAPALAQIASAVAPLLGAQTAVLTAMNGVPWWYFLSPGFGGALAGRRLESIDPDGRIARGIPVEHVLGCVVHASCSLDSPGVVRHHFGNQLIVGEPSGGVSARATELAALLEQAGIEVKVSDRIQRDIWFKLWGNMTVNPISAFTGATTDRIMGDPLVRAFASSVMLEAKAIGARIGIDIPQQPEDRHAITAKLGAFKTSMLQDVEAQRPVELDALVTVVHELGQLTAVATPFTDALLGLARLHACGIGLYSQASDASAV